MNYERIILEMLERIQILEEKVSVLEKSKATGTADLDNSSDAPKTKLVDQARAYISTQKEVARTQGKTELVLVCNDIQKALGVVNRAPAICTAMYEAMKEEDETLYAPESGKSTAVKIKYYLK